MTSHSIGACCTVFQQRLIKLVGTLLSLFYFAATACAEPVVTLSSPVDGAVFTMLGNTLTVPVSGSATVEAPGTIVKLEILDSGKVIYSGAANPLVNQATPALAIGPHVLQLRAVDNLGKVSASDPVTITVTATPPTVVIASPPQGGAFGTIAGSATINFGATVTAASGTSVVMNEIWEGERIIKSGAGTSFAIDFPLGPHKVEWRARDARGSVTSSFVDFTVVPAVPPAVTITSPETGAIFTVTSNPFQIPVSGHAEIVGATVNNPKIKTLELLVDAAVVLTSSSGTMTNVQTTGVSGGTHLLRLRATDSVGAVAISDPVSITLINTEPTATILTPVQGGKYGATAAGSAAVTVTGTSSGTSGASIDRVELWEGDVKLGSMNVLNPSFTKVFALGPHTLEWRAIDSRGIPARRFVDFTVVPGVPPTVTLTSPAEGAVLPMTGNLTSIVVSGSAAASDHATITKLDLLDEELQIYTTTGSALSNVSTPALALGPHVLRLRATDSTGRVSTSDPVRVTLTGSPPTASITAPANGSLFLTSTTSVTVVVSGTASGLGGATMNRIELFEGSTLLGQVTAANTATFSKPFTIGPHTLEWRATDARGQTTSRYVDFVVATGDMPIARLSTPLDGSSFALVSGTTFAVPVIGSASPVAPLTISTLEVLDGATSKYTISNVNALNTTIPLGVGSHALQIRAKDSSGKIAYSAIANVVVTVAPPTAKLATPQDGATYTARADGTFPLAITGSGTAVNAARVIQMELLEDGVVLQKVLGASFNVTLSFAVGSHAIQLRATDDTGRQALSPVSTFTVFPLSEGNSAEFVSQIVPATMRAGQPYTVTVKMLNTGTSTWTAANAYFLGSSNPAGTRTWNSAGRVTVAASTPPGAVATFTIPITAPLKAGVYDFQWQMMQELRFFFGDATDNLSITVADGPGPSSSLVVSPTNVRMVGTTPVTLTFAASAQETGGRKITKLDVLVDKGAGYLAAPVRTVPGNTPTLNQNFTATATAGVYKYIVRSTNDLGVQTDSAPVVVNINGNNLVLGGVTGIRIDGDNKPVLVGWLCKPGSTDAVPYQVLLDAPTSVAGGTTLMRGVADVGTEPDDAAVQTSCGTPGVSHGFKVDLSGDAPAASSVARAATVPLTNAYAGRALYVQAMVIGAASDVALPCADNNCTMPGSLRLGLTTPADGTRVSGPVPLFLRTQLSGGAAPYDEVAIRVDGVWQPASPDGAVDAFSATSAQLLPRTEPYQIQAKVRQGNTTLYSAINSVTVEAGPRLDASVTTPSDGMSFTVGGKVNLAAKINGDTSAIASVAFLANGTPIASGTGGGANWSAVWSNIGRGTYSITVVAYNGSGVLLAKSAGNSIEVGAGAAGGDDVPVPIVVSVDQLSNGPGGTLPGGVSVSDMGGAGYSLPILVPPGLMGVAPEISLNYDSNNPVGFAGLGWSLGGIYHIDRCGPTDGIDGRSDSVRFTTADRLCLNGQRLQLSKGNYNLDSDYWADGAEYGTEVESFARVTAIVSEGKRAFKVETKDGRIAYYGNTANTYIEAIGRGDQLAHRWYMSRSADRSGNYISYAYVENATTGESLPAEINWGGNTNKNTPHFAKATFVYVARPDPRIGYIAGSRLDDRSRLASIVTTVDTSNDSTGTWSPALTYTLTYTTSPSSGRSLLKTVQACDGTDSKSCLRETVFSWGESAPDAVKGFVALGGVRNGPNLAAIDGTNGLKALENVLVADFNGDGKADLLERHAKAGNNFQQHLYLSNADGSGWDVTTPLAGIADNARIVEVGDFDGDGLADLLIADSDVTGRLCLSSRRIDGAWTCDIRPVVPGPAFHDDNGLGATRLHLVRDFNGDGKDDIFIRNQVANMPNVPYEAYQCLSSGIGFNCINVTGTSDEKSMGDDGGGAEPLGPNQYADVDGDGRADRVLLSKCVVGPDPDGIRPKPEWRCGTGGFGEQGGVRVSGEPERGALRISGEWYVFPDKKTGVVPQLQGGALVADLNADGYTDMLVGTVELGASGTYGIRKGIICYSKGGGDGDCRALPTTNMVGGVDRNHLILTVGDFDGDGVYDVLRPLGDSWTSRNVTDGYQICHIGTNTALSNDELPLFQRCEAWSGPNFYTQSQQFIFEGAVGDAGVNGQQSMFYGDFDGDGKQDIVTYLGNGQWQVFSAPNQARSGEALDRLVLVSNGLGKLERIEYALPNDASVYQSKVARPDAQNTIGKLMYPSRPLVKAVHRDNGVAGVRDTGYRYYRQAQDSRGRGSLGFAEVQITDVQRGVVTTNWPCLTFPVVGADCGGNETTSAGVMLTGRLKQWGVKLIPQASGLKNSFPYIAASVVAKRDPSNNELTTTSIVNGEPDLWGNVVDSTVVTSNPANPTGWSVHSTMTYDNDGNNWLLGRLRSRTETRSNNYNSITRQSSFTYTGDGLLATETREGDATQRLVTTYNRSTADYGLVGQTIVSWTDNGSLKSRTVADVGYTGNGRFVKRRTNALGQVEQSTFDARTGMPMTTTSANGLVTSSSADGFGRMLSTTTPDGVTLTTAYRDCDSRCPGRAAMVTIWEAKRAGEVRVAVPELQFSDALGRPTRSMTWGFDGRKIVSDTVYDAVGRVESVYRPRYASDSEVMDPLSAAPSNAILQSMTTYDELDRPLVQKRLDHNGNAQVTVHTWQGDTHFTQNPKLQQIAEVRDVWGNLSSATDANGKTTAFRFDAFGNLARTTDPAGNVVEVGYDNWGRRTQLKDPDLGTIKYDVDALGQIWREQTPAQRLNQQLQLKQLPEKYTLVGTETLMTYDDLGRMVSRAAKDLNAKWRYDLMAGQSDCAAYKSCGQLVQSSTYLASGLSDFTRQHTYDAFGRPDTVRTFLDVTYTSKLAYDTWGRVVGETHQRASGLPRTYGRGYNEYGRLVRIQRDGRAVWTATAQDAEGRVTNATLGNGLAMTQTYSPYSGWLDEASGMAGGVQRLHEAYQYDGLGNVYQRLQEWDKVSFIENFDYDQLNRLKSATIAAYPAQAQLFEYDDVGNIRKKTGVGTGDYVYSPSGADSVRPHAVSSIAGLGSFTYDDNGNLIAGPRHSVSWTSFGMPLAITKSGQGALIFSYGPDHQRFRQSDSVAGLTTWYAGAIEMVGAPTGTAVKTYLPSGLGFEIEKAGVSTLYYTHRDRLGSVIALSDAAGNLIEPSAYDSWGKRRELAGPATPDTIDGVLDNKGFTGHEMLDRMDLVHMNGRVYDPLLARFLSADPVIQDPEHSQSYNRYSYVWNNPTNLTDPTGFVAAMPSSIAVQNCAQSAACQTDGAKITATASYDESGRWVVTSTRSADNSGSRGQSSASASADKGVIVKAWDVVKGAAIGLVENAAADAHDLPMGGRGRELGLDMPTPREMCGGCDYRPGQVLPVPANAEQELGRDLAPIASIVISGGRRPSLSGLSFGQMRTVLTTAQEAYKGSTVIGHALSKHTNRNPQIWGRISGSMKTWNNQAMTHFREIVRGPGEFKEVAEDGLKFLEKRLEDGRGVRLNMDSTFKGFID